MEFCGMKREIDRKCLNHARVHANAESFDRCETSRGVCRENMRTRENTRGFHNPREGTCFQAILVLSLLHVLRFKGSYSAQSC